ncbi:lipoprotein [Mycoplasma capricolum]|uniref:lipoprotein n=1 Tax=Mycoplasma capricolum TaxID=2095 RepID=UPI000B1858DA|nr:lipoprotein [Mycoplasma capricolum]
MKKLLTLLSSIGMVASTAAIAVACENKIPAISLNTDNTTSVKEKKWNSTKRKTIWRSWKCATIRPT